MQSPYYQNANAFNPSKSTLNEWLKTRKSASQIKPGLFETVGYSSDAGWSLVAILIELSALFLTIFGAYSIYSQNHKLSTVISAIVVVILFVAFDFIGVLLHEFDKPEKTKTKSLIVLEENPFIKQKLYDQLKEISWRQFLGIMLLVISGALKIFAIMQFAVGGKGSVPMIIILSLFYVVVIYIHGYHTGYWWSARRVKSRMKKERELWFDASQKNIDSAFNITHPDIRIFHSLQPMDNGLKIFQSGRQNIKELDKITSADGSIVFHYELTSKGCMWDEDVNSMLTNFNGSSNFHNSLLKACIALQLSQTGMIVKN